MSEQDKLAGERKLVELLVNKYNGKALHTTLLNSSHMKKREFNECVISLLEREAISADAYKMRNGRSGKAYMLADEIMESWKP